jgi:hypothetical protein
MTNSQEDIQVRSSFALETCGQQIAWFTKHKKEARLLYQSSQVLVIALGALTPILILISDNESPPIPKWLQALPATISAIVAGLSAIFHWRENWVSRAVALEALQSELFKFKTRTSEYYSPKLEQQEALDNFVQRVDRINQEELGNWRDSQLRDSPSKPKDTKALENQA